MKIQKITGVFYAGVAIYLAAVCSLLFGMWDELSAQGIFSDDSPYWSYFISLAVVTVTCVAMATGWFRLSSRPRIVFLLVGLSIILSGIALFAFGARFALLFLFGSALSCWAWRAPGTSVKFLTKPSVVAAGDYLVVALLGFFSPFWLGWLNRTFFLTVNEFLEEFERAPSFAYATAHTLLSCLAGGVTALVVYFFFRKRVLRGWLVLFIFALLAHAGIGYLSGHWEILPEIIKSTGWLAFWIASLVVAAMLSAMFLMKPASSA